VGVTSGVPAYKRENHDDLAIYYYIDVRRSSSLYIGYYGEERCRDEYTQFQRQRSRSRGEEVTGRNVGQHKAQKCKQGLGEENQVYTVQVSSLFA